jgi:hypothetical protein
VDHDQRFKSLIKEFFADFLRLFFHDWVDRFDCERVEWLEKELFSEPPEGSRRILDLVAKLPMRQAVDTEPKELADALLALVHIEIESPDRAARLRPRMVDAYLQLRRQHRLPVLPIALYLKVGLKGLGVDRYEERFGELRTLSFRYLYVGLPALDAVEYVQGENWLGVALAALMKVSPDRTAWLAAEALRRIVGAPLSEQQRFLLGDCVQAYLRLEKTQRQEFERLIALPQYEGVKAMNATWYDRGLEKGLEKGRAEGRRAALRELLEQRFGPLPPRVKDRLQRVQEKRLVQLTGAVLRAKSLKELGLDD